jgi:hypothetical protein
LQVKGVAAIDPDACQDVGSRASEGKFGALVAIHVEEGNLFARQDSWFGHLSIRLLNFALLPITALLLPRRMMREVASQVAADCFPNWHPWSGEDYRAMINRRLGIHRRRCDIP